MDSTGCRRCCAPLSWSANAPPTPFGITATFMLDHLVLCPNKEVLDIHKASTTTGQSCAEQALGATP